MKEKHRIAKERFTAASMRAFMLEHSRKYFSHSEPYPLWISKLRRTDGSPAAEKERLRNQMTQQMMTGQGEALRQHFLLRRGP